MNQNEMNVDVYNKQWVVNHYPLSIKIIIMIIVSIKEPFSNI